MQTERIDKTNDISMMDMLRILYQNKVLITLCTLLGLVLGGGIIYFSTPIYEAKISLTSANEGDIAEFNQGRSWSKSPLKPLTIGDVYRVFNDTLLAEATKNDFFEHYYLPALPANVKDGCSSTQLNASFSNLFAIVANPKQPDDRFAKYTVAMRGANATQVAVWLTQFLNLVKSQAISALQHDLQQQNQVLVENIRQQIDIARNTARAKRLDRIAQLKEKVHTVHVASARTPFWDDEPTVMSDENELSPFKVEMMQAEINNLAKRKSDDAFIPNLRGLQAKLTYYQSLKIDVDKVAVFHQDGILATPVTPIAPQKRLILMVSLVLGMLVGIFGTMVRIAWSR